MAHVEPTGLPVDAMEPALRDALSDVSTELVDARHTAHGTLTTTMPHDDTVLVCIAVGIGRRATLGDATMIERVLGGHGAPVLVRGLTQGNKGAHERGEGEDGSHGE